MHESQVFFQRFKASSNLIFELNPSKDPEVSHSVVPNVFNNVESTVIVWKNNIKNRAVVAILFNEKKKLIQSIFNYMWFLISQKSSVLR